MCTASLNCASTARFAAQVPSKLSFGKSAAVGAAGSLGRTSPSKSTGSRDRFEVTAGKMKTRKSAAKRYKVTASGKVRASSKFRKTRYDVERSRVGVCVQFSLD